MMNAKLTSKAAAIAIIALLAAPIAQAASTNSNGIGNGGRAAQTSAATTASGESIDPYSDLSAPGYTNSTTAGAGDSAAAAAADNLGNHIATRALDMSGYNIYNLAPATSANQAVRKDYVDALAKMAGSGGSGYVTYNGLTRTSGAFDGSSYNPTATDRLNYGGYLYATRFYSGMYLYFSDERLKKDIKTVAPETGMDIVRKMRPVSYAWKQSGEKALGVIAQETEKVIPTAVKTNEEGIKAVDYNQIISPMLAAIQDLDKRVTALEASR